MPIRQKKLNAAARATHYFAKTALRPVFKIFFFFILILEAARFKLEFEVALHQPNPLAAVATFLGLWLPLYAFIGLQLSIFVGLMLGIASMCKSRELDALHALGLGLHDLLKPVFSVVLLIGFGALLVVGWAQPLSLYATKAFAHNLQSTTNILLDGGDIFVRDNNKTVFIEDVSAKGKNFERMFSYEEFADGKTVTITGTRGSMKLASDFRQWDYKVKDASILELRSDVKGDLNSAEKSQTLSQSNTSTGNFSRSERQIFRDRGQSEFEWTLGELMFSNSTELPKLEQQKIFTEINYRLAQLVFILILPILAAIVVIEPRRNPGPLRQCLAAIFVLAFQQYLSIGANISRLNTLPPSVSLWLPLLLLSVIVMWRFWRLSFRPLFQNVG